jgi:hypothetical protein
MTLALIFSFSPWQPGSALADLSSPKQLKACAAETIHKRRSGKRRKTPERIVGDSYIGNAIPADCPQGFPTTLF